MITKKIDTMSNSLILKTIILATFIILLCGCTTSFFDYLTDLPTAKPVKKELVKWPEFPLEEYEALPKEGSGIVTGELFAVTRGGDVKYGAGVDVTLRPYTSYIENKPDYDSKIQELDHIDDRALEYDFKTKTDSYGKFEFTKVPPGKYQVYAFFFWLAGKEPQMIFFDKLIEVKNDETVKVQP